MGFTFNGVDLDTDQIKAVVSDSKRILITAETGSGKTTSLAAKVKYLKEEKGVRPDQIVITAFTNSAVNKLKAMIETIEPGCNFKIATLHALGEEIVNEYGFLGIRGPAQKEDLTHVIEETLRNELHRDEHFQGELFAFFSDYFEEPYNEKNLEDVFEAISQEDYEEECERLKKNFDYEKRSKYKSFHGENVRSMAEVYIANYLYIHGIDYIYEPIYPYMISGSKKPYTPDFGYFKGEEFVYLEYFGLNTQKYNKIADEKRKTHKEHQTTLKEITGSIQQVKEKLDEIFSDCKDQVRTDGEIKNQLVINHENLFLADMVDLLTDFLTKFKEKGLNANELREMRYKTQNVRNQLFLKICEKCYYNYESYLEDHHLMDFSDMLNEAACIIREEKDKIYLPYRYVIVDEYQDITEGAFDFIQALVEAGDDVGLIAAGDCWQPGKRIRHEGGMKLRNYIKNKEKEGYVEFTIHNSYNTAGEVLEVAKSFRKKENRDVSSAFSEKEIKEAPMLIFPYGEKNPDDFPVAVEEGLCKLKEEGENGAILFLGRGEKELNLLIDSGKFARDSEKEIEVGIPLRSQKHKELDLTYMSIYEARGSSYRNVFILNAKNGFGGFPAQGEVDPVMSFVSEDRELAERQLFYAALTRTEHQVFFFAPRQNPSLYLKELKEDYPEMIKIVSRSQFEGKDLEEVWKEKVEEEKAYEITCPFCGEKMMVSNVHTGAFDFKKLYICTNRDCEFMTNDMRGNKLALQKCRMCTDGYLIVKKQKMGKEYFLGCTNFKIDKDGVKYGCNCTLNE